MEVRKVYLSIYKITHKILRVFFLHKANITMIQIGKHRSIITILLIYLIRNIKWDLVWISRAAQNQPMS